MEVRRPEQRPHSRWVVYVVVGNLLILSCLYFFRERHHDHDFALSSLPPPIMGRSQLQDEAGMGETGKVKASDGKNSVSLRQPAGFWKHKSLSEVMQLISNWVHMSTEGPKWTKVLHANSIFKVASLAEVSQIRWMQLGLPLRAYKLLSNYDLVEPLSPSSSSLYVATNDATTEVAVKKLGKYNVWVTPGDDGVGLKERCFHGHHHKHYPDYVSTFCYNIPDSKGGRNPCTTFVTPFGEKPRRCFPYFVIMGWPKTGTSALYHYITHHPKVEKPSRKEVNYFDAWLPRDNATYFEYSSFFPNVVDPTHITGEASTEYSVTHDCPFELRQLLPETRLVVVLRDPVAQLYSYIQMIRPNEAKNFDKFVERIEPEACSQSCAQKWDVSCTLDQKFPCRMLGRGVYSHWLRLWLAVFPREQLLILKTEDLWADAMPSLRRMEAHLNLDPHNYDPDLLKQAVNTAGNRGIYQPSEKAGELGGTSKGMSTQTRDRLRAFYKPFNDELAQTLGADLTWNYDN